MNDALPQYAERLDALHRALVEEFRAIVGEIPLTGGERVLDAGCGDGFFTGLLAERLTSGEAIGLDASPAYLAAAATALAEPLATGRCRLVEGDVAALPFGDAELDAIFSAHSMQSYKAIPQVLQEFRRVLRPGGLLAVLETDNIHSIMLSWPPHVELAVRQAEHREIGSEDSYIGTYFPRFAPRLLADAGYEERSQQYVFIRRQQPASAALERYIELYLRNTLQQAGDHVNEEVRTRLSKLANPESPQFMPRQRNFFFGSLQVLIMARAGRTR